MADDVLHHHDGAFDDHAEVQSAKAEEIGRDVAEVETDRGEEQREGNGYGDDEGAAQVAEKQEEDECDEQDAHGEIVEHRGGGELQKITAVEEGDDLYAGWKDVVVELLDFGMDCGEGSV